MKQYIDYTTVVDEILAKAAEEITAATNKMVSNITIAFVHTVGQGGQCPTSPLMNYIKETCAKVWGIDADLLDKRTRLTPIIEARHASRALMAEFIPEARLKTIGKAVNNGHYSTVIHSKQVVEDWYGVEKGFTAYYDKAKLLIQDFIKASQNQSAIKIKHIEHTETI